MVDEKITHTSNRLRDETNIVDVPWPNFGPRARFTQRKARRLSSD